MPNPASDPRITIGPVTRPSVGREGGAKVESGAIVYKSAGSSSCPPSIDSVTVSDDGEFHLWRKSYAGMFCTADMSPMQQVISFTDGTSIPDNAVIIIHPETW